MNITKPATNKLQLFLVVIAVSILVISGGILYYNSERNQIRNEKYNELKAIADLKVNQIEQWYGERLSEAQFFSQNEPYVEIAKQVVKGNSNQKLLLRTSLSHILSNKRYENIFIVNKMGELVFSVDTTFSVLDTLSISILKKVYETKKVIFSDFYYSNAHKEIHLDIVAPIVNSSNEVFATLIFRVNPDDYLYPLIQNWPTPSRTAETLLVRKDGDSVKFLNKLRHADHIPLKLQIPLTKVNVPAVQAIIGHTGIFEGVDYRGVDVLSKIRPINNTPWFMVAKVDSEEIFAELYFRTMLIAIITFVLILFFGASVAWFYHYRQRNIYKKLLESEIDLHQSQEEFRATLYSIGDGVITTDKKGLVKQLNPVAEALTGWKETDAKGKKLEEVFNIINEETRSTVESPVSKVLKKGLIVGLANHTLLISKNGTEIPIADSGAPIKNRKGEIDGVVLVFRDQTEERANDKALRASEERFQMLFNKAPLGYQSLDIKGNFIDINQQWLDSLGYSRHEVIGKWFGDFLAPEYKDGFRERFPVFIAQGHIHSEFEMLHKNGEKRYIAFDGKIGHDKLGEFVQTHCILKDISEEKKAELLLQKNSEEIAKKIEELNQKNQELIAAKERAEKSEEILQEQKKEIEINNQSLESLLRISQYSSTSIQELLDFALEELILLTKSKIGYIYFYNENTKQFVLNTWSKEVMSECKVMNPGTIYDLDKTGCWGEAVRQRKPIVINNYVEENSIKKGTPQGHVHLTKFLTVPVIIDNIIVAVCGVANKDSDYDNSDIRQLTLLMDSVWKISERITMIKELTLAKEKTEESESKHWNLIEQMQEGLLVVNNDDVIVLVNPILCKMLGYQKEELIGQVGYNILLKESDKQNIIRKNLDRQKGIHEQYEVEMLTKKGESIIFLLNASPVKDQNGTIVGSMATCIDVTERKKAEAELRELKNNLELEVEAKTAELREKLSELERFHDATIDREIRMKELRDEIKRLKSNT